MKRYLSRKFIFFIVATVLLCIGKISEHTWLIAGSIYVGAEAVVDIFRTKGMQL